MWIDCQTCPAPGRRCGECVLTALLALPAHDRVQLPGEPGSTAPPSAQATGLALDPAERRAVALFVGAGLLGRERAGALRARAERSHRERAG
jgi:hypothetical protein